MSGFGNLTQQTVTKGTAPSMSMAVDQTTNRLVGTGTTYDLNGNMSLNNPAMRSIGYDVENRVAGVTAFDYSWESYKYSARNERLVVKRGGSMPASWEDPDEVHFHGVDGLLLGVYRIERGSYQSGYSWVYPVRVEGKERIYFHGRLIAVSTDEYTAYRVITDRLGSVVRHGTTSYRYYPYGQEVGGATANDKPKFGTYTRDAVSGLDYAMNRSYYSSWGRFTSPDPYQASGGTADPGSWNRYGYVGGDPVNLYDPLGLMAQNPSYCPPEFTYDQCFGNGGWGEGILPGGGGPSLYPGLLLPAAWWALGALLGPGPDEPHCAIQLKYLDVEAVPGPGWLTGNHAFLAVVGRTGGWRFIEGLPESSEYQKWGDLIINTGEITKKSDKAKAPQSGITLRGGTEVCDKVDDLDRLAAEYMSNKVKYNGSSSNPLDDDFGPNSNSLVRYLLNRVNLLGLRTRNGALYFPQPPNTRGWIHKINGW